MWDKLERQKELLLQSRWRPESKFHETKEIIGTQYIHFGSLLSLYLVNYPLVVRRYLFHGRKQRYWQNRIFVKCIRRSPNVFSFFFTWILRSLWNIRISRKKDKTKRNKGSSSQARLIVDCTTLLEYHSAPEGFTRQKNK